MTKRGLDSQPTVAKKRIANAAEHHVYGGKKARGRMANREERWRVNEQLQLACCRVTLHRPIGRFRENALTGRIDNRWDGNRSFLRVMENRKQGGEVERR